MIKAEEVRIGNYVYIHNWHSIVNGIFHQSDNGVNKIIIQGDDFLDYDIKFIKPIPISPEILEKCGFEKRGEEENDVWYILPLGYFFGHRVAITGNFLNGKWIPHGDNKPPLEYLHQLQNLYYCLTGTELTITL